MGKFNIQSIFHKVDQLRGTAIEIDFESFNDPIASKTAWTPTYKGGGANFCSHKLVRVNQEKLAFKITGVAIAIFGVFFPLPLIAFIFLLLKGQTEIVPWLIVMVLIAAEIYILYTGTAPIIFDKAGGSFRKGHMKPKEVSLENIYALQLLVRINVVSDSEANRTYPVYELNLVLKDGERVNVISHGNLARMKADAYMLSDFLGRPLWDAASGKF